MKLFIHLHALNVSWIHLQFINKVFLLFALLTQWIRQRDLILFFHSFNLIVCIIGMLYSLFFLPFLHCNHMKSHLLFFNNHYISSFIAILNTSISLLNSKLSNFIPSFIMFISSSLFLSYRYFKSILLLLLFSMNKVSLRNKIHVLFIPIISHSHTIILIIFLITCSYQHGLLVIIFSLLSFILHNSLLFLLMK